jgi:hypothetical protein
MSRWWGAIGLPFAFFGAVCGTAASPDYRMALTWWAVLTLAAITVFSASVIQNRGWVRWIYIALLACTCVVGIDPALRSIRLFF